ncbi:MAG: ribosome recycling factor [Luteibaculaceae bacterium]
MNEDVNLVLQMAEDGMKKAISHLQSELLKIRAGRANPSMLEGVKVDYYGTPTPINQVASVNTPDARTITLQPWEKKMMEPIQTAIINANLGFNPSNNGDQIIISIPPLTEERRKDLVKMSKSESENAKVGIRAARKDANDEIKQLQKDGLAEDLAKSAEDQIQKLTDKYSALAEQELAKKEKDILTV